MSDKRPWWEKVNSPPRFKYGSPPREVEVIRYMAWKAYIRVIETGEKIWVSKKDLR